MNIAVMSDTHGLDDYARQAMALCRELDVKRIIHCGDIGGSKMVDVFCDLPLDFVYGNCDQGSQNLLARRLEEKGGTLHGRFGSVEIEGVKIAFLHGDDDMLLDTEIDSGRWDLVCHGHTHRFELSCHGKTTVLNPGAFQRRWETPCFCVVTLPRLDVTRIPLR